MRNTAFAFYDANQAALVKGHLDEWIAIKDQTVIGYFKAEEDAVEAVAAAGIKLGEFIIKRCKNPGEDIIYSPHNRVLRDKPGGSVRRIGKRGNPRGKIMYKTGVLPLLSLLLLAACAIGLNSCENPGGGVAHNGEGEKEFETVTVTFLNNQYAGDTSKFLEYELLKNMTTTRPVIEPSKNKFRFTGWYTDAQGREEFDFNQPITADQTLYAGYTNGVQLPSVNGSFYTFAVIFDTLMEGKDKINPGNAGWHKIKNYEDQYGNLLHFNTYYDRQDLDKRESYDVSYKGNCKSVISIALTGYHFQFSSVWAWFNFSKAAPPPPRGGGTRRLPAQKH